MKEKYQVLHLTPATSPPDTLRPGRPKDPIPRGVCLAASAPFDRREARIRENNGKKSEGTPYWEGTKLLREQQKFISMSNQGWSSLMYVTYYSHPELFRCGPRHAENTPAAMAGPRLTRPGSWSSVTGSPGPGSRSWRSRTYRRLTSSCLSGRCRAGSTQSPCLHLNAHPCA